MRADASAFTNRKNGKAALPTQPSRRTYYLPLSCLVNFLVYRGNFTNPCLALFVLHFQDVIELPMKVVCDVRYLLV